MGKAKHDSDDDAMDIQEPIRPHKKIAKKTPRQSKSAPKPSTTKRLDVVRQMSRSVNLKQKSKSLEDKQEIFKKIVQGLKDKPGMIKKNQKKQRTLLKKEMRKRLDQQRIHRKSAGHVRQEVRQEKTKPNPQKFKKKEFDERAKVAQFQSLMGAGLQNIRDMVARNIGAK